MPQKKGCTPWNRGLTKLTDPRIQKSFRKINFSNEQINKIRDLYLTGIPPAVIGKLIGCSSHPIGDFLKANNLRRTISEARRIAAQKNKTKIDHYAYNGTILKVVDGYVNYLTGLITTESKLELKCKDCGKIFIRTFNGFRSGAFYNGGDVVCLKCSHKRRWLKYNRRVKTSSQ